MFYFQATGSRQTHALEGRRRERRRKKIAKQMKKKKRSWLLATCLPPSTRERETMADHAITGRKKQSAIRRPHGRKQVVRLARDGKKGE